MLELHNVTKIYPSACGNITVLDRIGLVVRDGDFLSVTGPSGSGKSTLMNILGCLDTPTSGRFSVDGRDVAKMSECELARLRSEKLGFVFQSFHLIAQYTALENVEIPLIYSGVPRSVRRSAAKQALALVGLSDRMTHRPDQLSGGQRQRVAIARAIIRSPSVILADEPTGNLDPASAKEIMDLLCEFHRNGSTLIIITHDHGIAAIADRRLSIEGGRLFENG